MSTTSDHQLLRQLPAGCRVALSLSSDLDAMISRYTH